MSPAVVNLKISDLKQPQRIFVLPTFMDSGKHNMMFKYVDFDMEICEWFTANDIVSFREEDINHFNKEIRKTQISSSFRKEASIFRNWQADNPVLILDCFDSDS